MGKTCLATAVMVCAAPVYLFCTVAVPPPARADGLICPARPALQSSVYGVGRTPSADDLKRLDIDVMPDGHGLPTGSGTAEQGRAVYARWCASCHGATGREGPNDILVGGAGTLTTARPLKTVGSFWPYATTLWDYVNRAMPFDRPGSLTADEVYAVTAYVLHLNDIVGAQEMLSERTLPAVKMPNREGFVR